MWKKQQVGFEIEKCVVFSTLLAQLKINVLPNCISLMS